MATNKARISDTAFFTSFDEGKMPQERANRFVPFSANVCAGII